MIIVGLPICLLHQQIFLQPRFLAKSPVSAGGGRHYKKCQTYVTLQVSRHYNKPGLIASCAEETSQSGACPACFVITPPTDPIGLWKEPNLVPEPLHLVVGMSM